jgi:hypothetical protein
MDRRRFLKQTAMAASSLSLMDLARSRLLAQASSPKVSSDIHHLTSPAAIAMWDFS